MKKEIAIKMLYAKVNCIERETSGTDEFCNSRRCDECYLNYAQGNMGEQIEAIHEAIKALESYGGEVE